MKERNVCVLWGFVLMIGILTACTPSQRIYISTTGNDQNPGTEKEPLASINKALELAKETTDGPVEIIIKGGHYEWEQALVLTPDMSGEDGDPLVIRAEGKEKVTVSGGRAITAWRKVGEDHWVADLPEVKAGNWYFRQLFAGEKRLPRARIPNEGYFKTGGPLSKYAPTLKKYTWSQEVKQEDPAGYWESRCGFHFSKGDVRHWKNWQEAEILTYHSWESSWQTIRSIDTIANDVYMNSPCRYPVGTFGGHMRYRVENVPEALDLPGEWYLDGTLGELHYLAHEGEDPRTMNMHAPFLNTMISFAGTESEKVENMEFRNIEFKYLAYQLGIYDIAPDWPDEIKAGISGFPDSPRPGYTDSQAAPRCGQGVWLQFSQNIRFDQCRFNHFGANAVHIDKGSSHITFNACEMYDMGGGGVYIGFPVREVEKANVPKSHAPFNNTISNCYIHSAGNVHPAAVGVWIAQGYDNHIVHNEIANISYTGVSTGWTWGGGFNYTKSNTIANNYIHHVAQLLGDAAGIYSLGDCRGTVYAENYLDQIAKGDGVHGVVDAMGFDEHSNNIRIERNVVGKISGKVASFHKNKPEDHHWVDNNFDLMVERPVLEHQDGMEAPELTAAVEFEMVSGFINLSGWTEQRWVFSKNGDQDDDGFLGMLVEGKRLTAILNMGGGKEGRYALTSKDVLKDDRMNKAAFSYDGHKLILWVNDEKAGERLIEKARKPGAGQLKIAPVSANSLRNGIAKLEIYPQALSPDELRLPSGVPSYSWSAPEKKVTKLNFNKIAEQSGPSDDYFDFLQFTINKPLIEN
jgi:hypothetical protein